MPTIFIECSASVHTNCGKGVTDDEVKDEHGNNMNKVPYICPECYRAGWRAEGIRTRPEELKVYQLENPPESLSAGESARPVI